MLPIGTVYNRSSVWTARGDLNVASLVQQAGMPDRIRQWNEDINSRVDTVFRLREGISRFFITDINNPAAGMAAASSLPVMFDGWATSYMSEEVNGSNIHIPGVATFNHVPGGSNVLYMDGHVEFIHYKRTRPGESTGTFPVTNGAYGYGREYLDDLSWGLLGKG